MVRLACQLSVVNYGTPASLAMDQVTRTSKRRSDGRSSFCGPAKRLKLTAVPLKRRSDCAKASAYGNMTPQLLNFKVTGSPKRKAYRRRKRAKSAVIVA